MDIQELRDRLAEQSETIELQRLQMAAQRQALEDLTAWFQRGLAACERAKNLLKEFP